MDDDYDGLEHDDLGFDDFECCEDEPDEGEMRLIRERDLRAYQAEVINFRLGVGDYLRPGLAAVIDAAFLLADPGGLANLVVDERAASAYDGVASRVWRALLIEFVAADLCTRFHPGAADDGDPVVTVPFEVVERVVDTELRAEYVSAEGDAHDAEFARLIGAEFGEDVRPAIACRPGAGLTIARLVHGRLGTFTVPRGEAD